MGVVRVATASLVAALVVVLAPTSAHAAPTAEVTPSTGLVELQQVTVSGSGFGASAEIFMCQAVDPGHNTPDPNSCGDGGIDSTVASSSGAYELSYRVRRFIYVPALGRTVDCVDPAAHCIIAVSDFFATATLVKVPISFATPPSPPATRGSIDITPDTAAHDEVVSVSGSGFRPGARVEVLQCQSGPDDPTDCQGDPITVDADTQGRFSTVITVARVLSLTTGVIDCSFADPACVIAAGEIVDFPRTVATAPLDVVGPGRPDVVIRRFGGTALTGDNVYSSTGAGQTRRRLVAPGGEWSFPVRVQNDGDEDSFVLTAPAVTGVRYFRGYFDITSRVVGSGFTFRDLPAGSFREIAVQVRVPVGATAGARIDARLTATSVADPSLADTAIVGAVVAG